MKLNDKREIIEYLVKSDNVYICHNTNIVYFSGLLLEKAEFKLKKEDIENLIDTCISFNFDYELI